MIKYVDLVKSVTKKLRETFPDKKVYALNPQKRDFELEKGIFYVLLEPMSRSTTMYPYERKMTYCRIFFKVHESNNFEYYNMLDKLRYEVLNKSIEIDLKLFDTSSTEPKRHLLPWEVSDNIRGDVCEMTFVFDFEDQYYIEPDMQITEALGLKNEIRGGTNGKTNN